MSQTRESLLPFDVPPLDQLPGADISFELPYIDRKDAAQILSLLESIAASLMGNTIVRDFALQIIHGDRSHNNLAEWAVKVAVYVTENVVFVPDPLDVEYVQSPLALIRDLQNKGIAYGDCDCKALLFDVLARSLGIPARIIGAKINGANYFNHVLNQVFLNGKWRPIDTCRIDNPFQGYKRQLILT